MMILINVLPLVRNIYFFEANNVRIIDYDIWTWIHNTYTLIKQSGLLKTKDTVLIGKRELTRQLRITIL